MLIGNIDFTKILFLDIECVSTESHLSHIDARLQELWYKKAKGLGALPKDLAEGSEEMQDAIAQSYRDKAAIYAEFGKVICISVGIFTKTATGELNIRLKSFANHEERVVLQQFADLLNKHFSNPAVHFLCGHNIKEFDIPYICRRMILHQIQLPSMLNLHGKKPWDVNYFIDTLHLWKFGDFKSYTSLNLLTALFGIPSPKDDIDGSQVGTTYWDLNDLERIAVYCQKDVLAVAQVLLYMQARPILTEDQVVFIEG
ncbi:MAG: hypothetical protein RI894_2525 [Bacteroidota bacterium]